MQGRPFEVAWQDADDVTTLGERYRHEQDATHRMRWQALWQLRQGMRLSEVAAVVGVNYRTVQQWVAWYRVGGLAEVLGHRREGPGRASRLTDEQQRQVWEQAAQGTLRTAQDAVVWVREQFGVHYTHWGMYKVFRRLRVKKKVPRPLAEKADRAAQADWKKGG